MKFISAMFLAMVLVGGSALAQTPQTSRIQGDVLELKGSNLSMKSIAGETIMLKMADPIRLLTVAQSDVSAIKPHSYVAVTALPQADGSLLASRINIFPESMRGVGEGHRPMAAQPGNTMTNATVANIGGGNTMTNATVTTIADATQSHKLTVQYPGGEKQVVVPAGLAIMVLDQGDRAMLVPGTHITAVAKRLDDGTLQATSITAGKNGVVPPP
ncbi:MAG: DUF5666 domain-containing protein [Burkholderiaceae bacterium]